MKPLTHMFDSRGTVSSVVVLSLASLIAASSSSGLALLIGLSSWAVLLICTAVLCVLAPVLRKEPLLLNAGSAFTLSIVAALLATVVTILSVTLQFFRYEASVITGLWLPLIASNALIYLHLLGTWEQADAAAIKAALWRGALFCTVLLGLAVLRELLGTGVVLRNLHLLNPAWSEAGIVIISDYPRLKLFAMSSGGLVVTGMMLALFNWIKSQQTPVPDHRTPAEDKRVRVTGRIR